MSQRLKDLRQSIQTIEEADREFENIALLECDITKLEAACEAEIARIKADYEKSIGCFMDMREAAVKRLSAYIESHRAQFQKPRRRKTKWGTYGLTEASRAQVDNKDDAIQSCLDQGWKDCVKTTLTLMTKPLRDRLQAGEKCTGARLISGDIASYTVKKELIDEAKKKA